MKHLLWNDLNENLRNFLFSPILVNILSYVTAGGALSTGFTSADLLSPNPKFWRSFSSSSSGTNFSPIGVKKYSPMHGMARSPSWSKCSKTFYKTIFLYLVNLKFCFQHMPLWVHRSRWCRASPSLCPRRSSCPPLPRTWRWCTWGQSLKSASISTGRKSRSVCCWSDEYPKKF